MSRDQAEALVRMQEIKDLKDQLEDEYELLRDEVVVPMAKNEQVLIVGADGKKYRVSKVVNSTAVYNYSALELLNPDQIKSITETKIVAPKLQAEVQAKRISNELLLRLVSYRPNKPFPKFDLAE